VLPDPEPTWGAPLDIKLLAASLAGNRRRKAPGLSSFRVFQNMMNADYPSSGTAEAPSISVNT